MERPSQFPHLSDFLSALRFAGVPIGPHEIAWLQRAFQLEPSLNRQGLKDLLACTLIKHETHREVFESLFADWWRAVEATIPEPPDSTQQQTVLRPFDKLRTQHEQENSSDLATDSVHPELVEGWTAGFSTASDTPQKANESRQKATSYIRSALRTFWRPALLSLLVIVGTALAYYFWPPSQSVVEIPPPPPPPPKTAPSVTRATQTALPSDPAQEFWTWIPTITIDEPSIVDSVWAAVLLALLSGCSGLLLRRRYQQHTTLPKPETTTNPGPLWVPLRSTEHFLPELVDREALRTAVWGVERFISEEETTVVDVERTVAATARAGGMPIIRQQHAVYPREVWLWHDVMVQDVTVNRLLRELESSLTRAGLPVRVGTFAETPGLIRWREGQEFSPLVLEGHRQHALVAILTDGYGLQLAAESELEKTSLSQTLKAFSEWPRLTFVDVGEEKHGLTPFVARYGLRCITPQEIPAFLAASPVTVAVVRQRESQLFGDLRAWAAATALSPEPVTEEQAFALRQRLGLDLSPWQFRDVLRESNSTGDRIIWASERRAELLNWLTQCSTKDGVIIEISPLARALAYWIAQYQEEVAQRREQENELLRWRQSKAEQLLRMEIALLELWQEPEKATEELYRLYRTLKDEICERLAQLADWSQHGTNATSNLLAQEEIPSNSPLQKGRTQAPPFAKGAAQSAGGFAPSHRQQPIYLPWHESKLSPRTRLMLAKMGFAGRELPKSAKFQMPVKLSLALGACAGLTLVALSATIMRLLAPATPVFQPVLPEPFQTVIIQDAQRSGVNDYRIAIGTPKELRTETVTAYSMINIQSLNWQLWSKPNIEPFGQSELWHTGTLPQAIRGCEANWPRRSLFVIQAEPSHVPARQLAIQLLDRGSADRVLLGTDWASHLDKLIQIDTSLTKNDQLIIILPSDAVVPKVDFRGAVGTVSSLDLSSLIPILDFPEGGVLPLTAVWDNVQTTGDPLLRSGPMERRDDKTGMTFATVCGGTFTMGSQENDDEKPPHPVTLSTFEISKTEVTNAQYRQFRKDHEGEDNLPAAGVSWDEAKAFCENYGYSLPTEAEWEYAARGGSTTRWSFGDENKELENYAWFSENSGDKTHPVGTKLHNPLGLFDMHGNVWEWVEDCYDEHAYQDRSEQTVNPFVAPTATGSCSSSSRVLRGGSWGSDPERLRSTSRNGNLPGYRIVGIGFRCVRAPRRQP